MAIRSDVLQQLADYRGILGWNSFTEVYTNTVQPALEIPLYIKEASVPIRKLKATEISTIQTTDPGSGIETTTNVLFFGAPDILQISLSGWTVTPTVNGVWMPRDKNGNLLNYGQLSYNDIIGYYIEGRFNRNLIGTWQRKDPDYYISPRGQYYTHPTIGNWQPTTAPVMKKQQFEMTLYLES